MRFCRLARDPLPGIIHHHDVIHRDLKLENCSVNCAAAASFTISERWVKSVRTTLVTRAPEVINDAPYTKASDVWALGRRSAR